MIEKNKFYVLLSFVIFSPIKIFLGMKIIDWIIKRPIKMVKKERI
jgi:hypothetical protein